MVLVTSGTILAHDDTHFGFVAWVVPEAVSGVNIALSGSDALLLLSKHVVVNLEGGCF